MNSDVFTCWYKNQLILDRNQKCTIQKLSSPSLGFPCCTENIIQQMFGLWWNNKCIITTRDQTKLKRCLPSKHLSGWREFVWITMYHYHHAQSSPRRLTYKQFNTSSIFCNSNNLTWFCVSLDFVVIVNFFLLVCFLWRTESYYFMYDDTYR